MIRTLAILAALTLAGTATAEIADDGCPPAVTERFSTAALVADPDARRTGRITLDVCTGLALGQLKSQGEIEPRLVTQIVALAGRLALAGEAAGETASTSAAMSELLENAFETIHADFAALPEAENAALTRALGFHIGYLKPAEPAQTGSVPR